MVEILGVLVSLDVFQEMFCCDLSKCHGICCVEGDAGAPVDMEEVEYLEESLDVVWEDLNAAAQAEIDKNGVVYPDIDGDLVTSIVRGKDCVFVKYADLEGAPNCALCAIDSAFRAGKFHWQKPISCALYPIRVKMIGGAPALNYHKWDVCKPARELGRKLHLPLYQFLKEPLIRRFGQEWYDECCKVAEELKKAGYL